MKKSKELKELEMTQHWLAIYMDKLDGVLGETIGEKIDFLLGFYNSKPQQALGTLNRSIFPPPFRNGEELAPHLIELFVGA